MPTQQTRQILIVDDDSDLRSAMTQLFEEQGDCRVLVAASLEEVKKLGIPALGCDAAILDINLGYGQPDGLEIFDWLRSNHFKGRVAFFTGHAHDHPLVVRAMKVPQTLVCEKPVGVKQLLELLQKLTRPASPEIPREDQR